VDTVNVIDNDIATWKREERNLALDIADSIKRLEQKQARQLECSKIIIELTRIRETMTNME
jgi:hypothetical protein